MNHTLTLRALQVRIYRVFAVGAISESHLKMSAFISASHRENYVTQTKLVDSSQEAEKLLAMLTQAAEALFQSYSTGQQLEIISSTRNARDREELYYLAEDCTELVQNSPTQDVLQILDRTIGTGLASIMLQCLSPEQFEELMDLTLWRNGKLDDKSLNLWLYELSECDRDELGYLLARVDVRLIANMLHDRVKVKTSYKALFIEAGLIDPTSKEIVYADERTRDIVTAIWEADEDLFTSLLNEIFTLEARAADREKLGLEPDRVLDQVKEQRDERVQARDTAAGIDITEEEVLEKVDLESLNLEGGNSHETSEKSKIEDDEEQKNT